jgi:DNA-binding transcriptional ArsR family regulator
MTGKKKLPLDDSALEMVAQRFRLLGEPQRLRILQALEDGELSVNELSARTGASQPNVSKHLAALFEGGLIQRRRDGNNVQYAIADLVVFLLCELVCRSRSKQGAEQAIVMRKASASFSRK